MASESIKKQRFRITGLVQYTGTTDVNGNIAVPASAYNPMETLGFVIGSGYMTTMLIDNGQANVHCMNYLGQPLAEKVVLVQILTIE